MKSKSILLFTFYFLLFTLIGCDAFVRKFTRPPKKKALSHEDMVLAPEQYQNVNKEEIYRQYFVFWESWIDELINALELYPNYKKRLDAMERALKNLVYLKTLLNEAAQKKLDVYIERTIDLQVKIKGDPYGNFVDDCATEAGRLQLDISRNFSYSAVKNSIVK